VWKVGFSGEGRPRDVFAVGSEGGGLWRLSSASGSTDRNDEDRQLEAKMQNHLRSVFHEYDYLIFTASYAEQCIPAHF
jgi:actin-related protein 10